MAGRPEEEKRRGGEEEKKPCLRLLFSPSPLLLFWPDSSDNSILPGKMTPGRPADPGDRAMTSRRKYLFPRVIELNLQAGRPFGVNLYLIDGGSEYVLLDIGL